MTTHGQGDWQLQVPILPISWPRFFPAPGSKERILAPVALDQWDDLSKKVPSFDWLGGRRLFQPYPERYFRNLGIQTTLTLWRSGLDVKPMSCRSTILRNIQNATSQRRMDWYWNWLIWGALLYPNCNLYPLVIHSSNHACLGWRQGNPAEVPAKLEEKGTAIPLLRFSTVFSQKIQSKRNCCCSRFQHWATGDTETVNRNCDVRDGSGGWVVFQKVGLNFL